MEGVGGGWGVEKERGVWGVDELGVGVGRGRRRRGECIGGRRRGDRLAIVHCGGKIEDGPTQLAIQREKHIFFSYLFYVVKPKFHAMTYCSVVIGIKISL